MLRAVSLLSCMVIALAVTGTFGLSLADDQKPAADPAPASAFKQAFMENPKYIDEGHDVWKKRCVFCHGRGVYPGKAPQLNPAKYTPDFIFDRVTNGFRGMPSWKSQFNEEQRMAVAAYVLSADFGSHE